MFQTIFESLFKYAPVRFQEGEIILATPWPVGILIGVVALLGVTAAVSYGRSAGKTSALDRTLLVTLRVAALGILTFALLQPTLVVSRSVPGRNFVGILLDDARSMNLPGEDGAPRRAWMEATFGPEGSELVESLADNFALRFFRFSSEAARVEHAGELDFDGTRTDLAGALDAAREALASVPVGGLVVVSDGAENGDAPLTDALTPLQAASIPVYAVGLGAEELTPDVQVSRVEVPRQILRGTGMRADVILDQRGLRGRTVELLVEDGPRILAQESVELGADGEPTLVRVPLTLDEEGPRFLRFRVAPLVNEAVTENNARTRLVEVSDLEEDILYFEGEPRWESKFLRRAVEEDANLRVVTLQRTAPEKFQRYNVEGPEELAGGFPRTREELYRYRGLILGSVEASFFTRDQLQMISDFVGDRGGGLLVLGGRRSLAEGGYGGTAVEDVLPVYLEEPVPDPQSAWVPGTVRPTPAGENHPVGRLGEDGWDGLPPVASLNRVVREKPGATTLLTLDVGSETRPALVYQRFGRGKSAAQPLQDTWHWQMHADIPVDDRRHETYWQQLLRWLVDGVPAPVSASFASEQAEPGKPTALRATVLDSAYIELNDAQVTARITHPSGAVTDVVLPWTVETDGEYSSTFVPPENGTYRMTITAEREGALVGQARSVLEVGPSREEYFDAGRRTGLLARLANETGGRFYTPRTAGALVEDLPLSSAGVTLTEEHDLWDMPIILILLLGLLGAEWGLRRVRGYV